MIKLAPNFLMMIEPSLTHDIQGAVNDEWTMVADMVLKASKPSKMSYKGIHRAACGACSDNRDWITPMGRTTHLLLVHYISFHREEIPSIEFSKLEAELIFMLTRRRSRTHYMVPKRMDSWVKRFV
jgi:hypothetical protein